MRKIGCFIAAIFVFSGSVFAISKNEIVYRNIYQTEKLGFYAKARQDYFGLTRDLLNKKQPTTVPALTDRIPILVSTAFRLGIVTSKTSFYDVHPLSYQLDMFKATDDVLEDVILYMTQLHEQYPNLVPKQQYAMLFFARAYNRVGWSSKLVFAIPWKQYVVHPPSDCVMMLNSAAEDLVYLKDVEGIPEAEKSAPTAWSSRLKKMDKNSLEYRTYQLTNLEDDPDELGSIFFKRYTQNILPTLVYIRSQPTVEALEESRHNTSYQDIISKKNAGLFDVFGEVTRKIGIN